jgi:hypothetical protein
MPQIVIKNVQTSLLRSQSTLLNAHAATMLLFDLIKIWASGQAKSTKSKKWEITAHSFQLLPYLVKYAQIN